MKLIMENWRKFNEEEEKPDSTNAKLVKMFQSSGVQAVELGQMVDADQNMVKAMGAAVQAVKEFISTADDAASYAYPGGAARAEMRVVKEALYQFQGEYIDSIEGPEGEPADYGALSGDYLDAWDESFTKIRKMIDDAHREYNGISKSYAKKWPALAAQYKKWDGSIEQLEQWAGV
jgi:hypothetical protein